MTNRPETQLDRRKFLRLVGATTLGVVAGDMASCAFANKPATHRPPNIIHILIDDMGYTDVGCFGSTFYETPNIDRFAASATRFTQAYAACPVCSPTRASIMTGKYPARLHLTDYLKGTRSPKDSPLLTAPYLDALPLEEVTIPEVLVKAGYINGHVGKWHLGNKGFWPEDQGFQFNAGGCQSGSPKSYFWPQWGNNPPIRGRFDGQYLADALTDEACGFIENYRARPFFLNFCHHSVHIPIEAKPGLVAKYEAKLKTHPPAPGAQNNPYYAAMVESVDESVGRVLDTLRRLDIAENTAVFFFSDNGGLSVKEGQHTPATTNAPLRDGKGYLHEGGIREPLIIRWPGVTKPGSLCKSPVCSIDFLPTMAAMAGVDLTLTGAHDIDGIDLTPLLRNPHARLQREALYWHYPHFANQGGRPGGAVRAGDWKLIENFEHEDIELYNLRDDIGETRNLAKTDPRRVRQMLGMLRKWRAEVSATMLLPNPGYRERKQS